MKKQIVLIAALFALAAGPAHAGPIAAAFTWIGSLHFAAGIGGALARLAVGIGLNLLTTALAKKFQKTPSVDVRFEVELGDDTALKFSVGNYATAGKRKYIGAWSQNKKYITEVIEISCLPQPGQPGLWINDVEAEINWSVVRSRSDQILIGYETYTTENGEGSISTRRRPVYETVVSEIGHPVTNFGDRELIWVKYKDGSQTAADPLLMTIFADDPEYPWTENHIGAGKSYLIVTCQFDADDLSSYPSMLIVPPPLPMYDPRRDSSAGGVGPHRWGDRSTYAPSTNAAVIAYNVARGIYWGDEWLFGGQNLAAWRLPFAEWVAAMNACTPSGGEGGYHCGAEISVDMEPLSVMEEIGRAANMRFSEVGGRLKPIVGLPGSAVLSITDDDIIISEGQSFSPFVPVSQTYNALTATYPEPAEKWSSKTAPEYIDAEATADDGGRYLPVGVTYSAVPYAEQVQRLSRAQMRDYRRMRTHQFSLPPDAYGLEPLVDVISWTSARNGYAAKWFVVESVAKSPGMNVHVTLREVDPSDYDWNSDWEKPSLVSPIIPVRPMYLQTRINLVEGLLIEDSAARGRVPAIRVTAAGGVDGIGALRVQIRRSGETAKEFDLSSPFTGGPVTITGIVPATSYEVRALYVSTTGARVDWSAWHVVLTPDLVIGLDDLDQDLTDDLNALHDWIDAGVTDLPAALAGAGDMGRTIMDRLRALSAEALEVGTRSQLDSWEGRELIAQVKQTLGARIDLSDGQISLMAQAVTALQLAIPGLATADAVNALTAIVTAQGGRITAMVDALTRLGVTVGESTATAILRMTTEATPAGALARIGLKVAATATEGDARTAALFLEAITGNKSRVLVEGDAFFVLVGGARVPIFSIADGVIRLNAELIKLTGSVEVDGSFKVDGPMIVNGAVSQRLFMSGGASFQTVTAVGAANAVAVSNTVTASFEARRGEMFRTDNPVMATLTATTGAAVAGSLYYALQWRAGTSGAWSEQERWFVEWPAGGGSNTHSRRLDALGYGMAGLPDTGQYRLVAYLVSPATTANCSNVLLTLEQLNK